jgi:hypothetical protein
MPEPSESSGQATPPSPDEDGVIRQRVRELTSRVLQQGRVDPAAVADIVRAVAGQRAEPTAPSGEKSREAFADAVRELDEALLKSAHAAHDALQQLSSRGKDFTDNDLKDVLVSLRKLEEDYVATANRIAEAMSGNLRREMTELAGHAQAVGAEASARIAGIMGEFAGRMRDNTTSGLETMRGTSIRVALLASGVLAGVADALRDLSEARKAK